MATSPPPSSSTALHVMDEHDVMIASEQTPGHQDHLPTEATMSNPVLHAHPHDLPEPFSASLQVWTTIPQEAR